mgnify:CR=1 FL=1
MVYFRCIPSPSHRNMFENFPVKVVDPLPKRIDPCPIVQAVFEIRFTTTTPWAQLPGRVAGLIGDHYVGQVLPLFELPDQFKQQIPGSVHLPQYQFQSEQFVVNLGPQMIGLGVQAMNYPGWSVVHDELKAFLTNIVEDGFMEEGARLGVRYSDFFELNIFDHIDLDIAVNGKAVKDKDRQFTTVFQEGPMTIRLVLINGAIMENAHGPRRGSVLDIDVAYGSLDFDLNSNVLERFTEAHDVIKKLFFGLVSADLLEEYKPEYR